MATATNKPKEKTFLLSQHLDFKNEKYRGNGCGIVSLLMLMRYWQSKGMPEKNTLPSPDQLYKIGLERGAYVKDVGWSHAGLAELAKYYGFGQSQNFDWAKERPTIALAKLKRELKNGPVLASVFYQYKLGNGGHLVVLESLTRDKVKVWDPDKKDRIKIEKTMSLGEFLKAWKRRIIIVR